MCECGLNGKREERERERENHILAKRLNCKNSDLGTKFNTVYLEVITLLSGNS